jgi:hypothetical protein
LGSKEARLQASSPPTYFLTSGWLRHENNLVSSYEKCIEKYGQRQAQRINRIMLQNYRRFGLVETCCYDMEQARERVQNLAELLDLSVEKLPGDLDWLHHLLSGHHDDPSRFIVIPANAEINFDQWAGLLMGPQDQSLESG